MKAILVKSFLLCSLFVVLASIESQAAVRHVPTDFATIQQAINASVNGDSVLVAPGTYVENINFLGKSITVMSEAGPGSTIIDGNQVAPVATFASGEGRAAVLKGFTLQNGRGDGFLPQGGGVRIVNSSPTIMNNIITKNGGCQGIGMLVDGGSPLIQNNTITENTLQLCSGGSGGGGILIINNSTAQILDNTISKNALNSTGGGISR